MKHRPGGETGRRTGLKIPGPVKGRTGSIPVLANEKTGLLRKLRSSFLVKKGKCHQNPPPIAPRSGSQTGSNERFSSPITLYSLVGFCRSATLSQPLCNELFA